MKCQLSPLSLLAGGEGEKEVGESGGDEDKCLEQAGLGLRA